MIKKRCILNVLRHLVFTNIPGSSDSCTYCSLFNKDIKEIVLHSRRRQCGYVLRPYGDFKKENGVPYTCAEASLVTLIKACLNSKDELITLERKQEDG